MEREIQREAQEGGGLGAEPSEHALHRDVARTWIHAAEGAGSLRTNARPSAAMTHK